MRVVKTQIVPLVGGLVDANSPRQEKRRGYCNLKSFAESFPQWQPTGFFTPNMIIH